MILDLSPRVPSQEEGIHGPARATRRKARNGKQQLPPESEDSERREQQFAQGIATASLQQLPEKPIARHQPQRKAFTTR